VEKNMNEKRKGEIAYAILKDAFREQGVRKLDNLSIRRRFGNLSKRTDISKDELLEFGKFLLSEIVEEAFKKE